jgi:hypothetical protein
MWSKENKFVFIHSEKCAGTSIRHMIQNNTKFNFTMPENQHESVSYYVDKIGYEELENKYFIFSCTRNPWDRMVSLYFHNVLKNQCTTSFNSFIKNMNYETQRLSGKYKFFYNNKNLVNFILRRENFDEDIKFIMKKLNIKNYNIINYNHGLKRKNKSYKNYYTQETMKIVSEKFYWDIKKFNYVF